MLLCFRFSIGYPVISLGFSFKSYVGHRFRLRRQKLVARQNDTMVQLLQEALPPDMALDESPERRGKTRLNHRTL